VKLTRREGTALLVTMLVIGMLALLATVIMLASTTRSNTSVDTRFRIEAMAAAEAGVGLVLEEIVESEGDALDLNDPDNLIDNPPIYVLPGATDANGSKIGPGATVTVVVEDIGDNGIDDDDDGDVDNETEQDIIRLVSTAEVRGFLAAGGATVRRTIEAYLVQELHPLFYKATFVGNQDDVPGYQLTFGPSNGNPNRPPHSRPPGNGVSKEPHSNNADFIDGDVYVNGNLQITGGSKVWGDVDVTGSTTGAPASGANNNGVDRITPPDLAAHDYESMADYVISGNSHLPWIYDERGGGYYGSYLSDSDNHDLPYYHLGAQNGDVSIPSSDDGTLIFVKGNLWLHTTSTLILDLPSGHDVRVTIVVEGNIFIADDLEYGSAGDGVLLIAKGIENQESYVDTNLNYRRDENERIINDDGDGVYEGPKEGSGNVYFGDPRFGTGGVTDGFIYAENNVYLVNEGTEGGYTGSEHIFGVKGFLSAGRQMLLGGRQPGNRYDNFRVEYDDRIEMGDLDFKGLPGPVGGEYEGLRVVTWRELPPS
jgi:hypothetical protein